MDGWIFLEWFIFDMADTSWPVFSTDGRRNGDSSAGVAKCTRFLDYAHFCFTLARG